MNARRISFRPRVEALEDRSCPSATTELPITAFLSQQGTSSVFTPPVPDQLAFNNTVYDPGATSSDPYRVIMIDYTGQAATYLLQHGINLHTTVTGFVSETPIVGSGKMEVIVNLEATNALTWVANVPTADLDTPAVNTDPLELGYRPQDLVANPRLQPALSNMNFQFSFQEQAGQPLPDLVRALIIGDSAPAGFAPERISIQSWGTGILQSGTTVGTPGQTAIVATSQVADLTNSNLPGTYADGFFQEPVDILPVASSSTHLASLNGTVYVIDMTSSDDTVVVTPTVTGGANIYLATQPNSGGGATTSYVGTLTVPSLSKIVIALSTGTHSVSTGNLPAATVDVAALDGDNKVAIGNVGKLVIHLGAGDNTIVTGNAGLASVFINVNGNGNNFIHVDNSSPADILIAGNGDNRIRVKGIGDFIEVAGNGTKHIKVLGHDDRIWIGGDGKAKIKNAGAGSFTDVLSGPGRDHIRGPWKDGL